MFREPLDRVDVRRTVSGVVAPLEFLQHRLSEMGHRNLLVTLTLPDRVERASRVASAAPAASFKRRSVERSPDLATGQRRGRDYPKRPAGDGRQIRQGEIFAARVCPDITGRRGTATRRQRPRLPE